MDLIKIAEEAFATGKEGQYPKFKSGDTVTVAYRIIEGNKERVQLYRGVVIKISGHGDNRRFTVRKMSGTVGVERIFPISSPAIDSIEVTPSFIICVILPVRRPVSVRRGQTPDSGIPTAKRQPSGCRFFLCFSGICLYLNRDNPITEYNLGNDSQRHKNHNNDSGWHIVALNSRSSEQLGLQF